MTEDFKGEFNGDRRSVSSLSIELPQTWHYKESYTLLAPDGQANLIMSSEPLADEIDSDAYAHVQGEILGREFPDYAEITFEPYVIEGLDGHGWIREFQWVPPDGAPVRQTQIYGVAFGRGYTATATSPVTEYERYRADMAALLSSIAVDVDKAALLQKRTADTT